MLQLSQKKKKKQCHMIDDCHSMKSMKVLRRCDE